MAKEIKMCNMSREIVVNVFQMLNSSVVRLKVHNFYQKVIITDVEPKYLVYPEGWYYAKGCLRNKHTSTTGIYSEIPMFKSNGDNWGDFAIYSTRD